MSELSKADLIQKLRVFIDRLEEWKSMIHSPGLLKISGLQGVAWEEMRDALTVEASTLKPLVTRLTGVRYFAVFGQRHDPWLEAFSQSGSPDRGVSLGYVKQQVLEAIGELESDDIRAAMEEPAPQKMNVERPKVMICHDGESELRDRLELKLWRMGLEPTVAEESVSQDESVDDKVDRVLEGCNFAIVLARRERGVSQDSSLIPRGNVIDEIGRVRRQMGDKYIILLEEGLTLPSNLSTGVIWEPFKPRNFDRAILKVSESLKANGVL